MAEKSTSPIGIIKKDRTVSVTTKNGQSYSYSYSTLAEIHRFLEATGQKYEAFIKKVDGEDYMFIRKLSANEEILVELQEAKIPNVSGIQDYGSILTSCRRFSLLMAYGLACEDDVVNPESTPEMRWKKMHTPDVNKPASAKQLETIRKIAEDIEYPQAVVNEFLSNARNQLAASKIIKQLIEIQENRKNETTK